MQHVIKSHQPQFANNKARISNNPHKNSGFFHYVIFVSQELTQQQHFYLNTVGLKLYSLWGHLKTVNSIIKNLKMPKGV